MDLRMFEFTWRRVMAGIISTLDVCFLYLDAGVDTAKQRISERSRGCEAGLPDSYIEKIHRLHDEWLATQNKCFRVDASKDKDAVLKASLDQISAWMLEAATREVASREQAKERSSEEDSVMLTDLSSACGLPV